MSTPNILVRDYMKPLSVFFSPSTGIEEVVDQLVKNRVMGAPVLDENRKLVGFITEQDCIKQMLNDSYYSTEHEVAGDIMRTDPFFIHPDVDIMSLAEQMLNRRPKLYPVCEEGRIIGMIARADVLRALSEFRRSSHNKV
ncbi:CBS domain-containing protein [Marinobacteraceae bacterium S3BR75-40.1]